MKKLFAIVIISITLFSLAGFVFAQEEGRPLETEYPEVAGEKPEETTTPVAEYFKYIFNFLIWISGLIALVVLVYAGFQYFTSAGNPEAMNDAKSRIGAALLGLLILFGSYLILITINPNLIVFHLPRLRPIISELTPGVLVCKEQVKTEYGDDAVLEAWSLTYKFKSVEEYWEQKMIAEELEQIFKDISDKCYMITTAENIRSDFDNKITDIYFIPSEQMIDGKNYAAIYGAILYENSNFEEKSQPIYKHIKNTGTVLSIDHESPQAGLNPSSIRPFVLIPQHHEERWQVTLYQEYNQNTGTDLIGKVYMIKPGTWFGDWDIVAHFYNRPGAKCTKYPGLPEKDFCSLRSIKAGGPFIAILITPDGRSEAFANVIDNNLDDNHNIVNWVDCKEYETEETKTEITPGKYGYIVTKKCAQPAIKKLIIISAKLY